MSGLFVVAWTISVWVSDPCPDTGRLNEYTGEPSIYGCLVNHGHFEQKSMTKEFSNKDEAIKFIADAPENIRVSMHLLAASIGPSEAKQK